MQFSGERVRWIAPAFGLQTRGTGLQGAASGMRLEKPTASMGIARFRNIRTFLSSGGEL